MLSDRSVRPFLRWAGSKRKLVPALAQYWNGHATRYIEPFAGSAALYFALAPKKALLADINKELIQTYAALRDQCEDVIQLLEPLPASSKETYLALRQLQPEALTLPQVAARFIYLNRHCFNGLYRTNTDGRFNVPFSAVKTGKIPSPDELRACATLLSGTVLRHYSFQKTLSLARQGDFVYLDPPYLDSTRRVFREYDADCFGVRHLESLREALVDLDHREIRFVLSFTDSKEGRFLARGFRTSVVSVGRTIAGASAHRRQVDELLVSNFKR